MSCQNKKYIHIGGWMYGLGSQLMTYELLLSYAFRMNRIMLWNPKDIFPYFQKNGFCKGDKTFDCVFHPLMNCTPTENDDIFTISGVSDIWDKMKKFTLPTFINSILVNSSINPSSYEWYWRAQAMTYIYRPLPNIMYFLKRQSKELSSNGNVLYNMKASIYVLHGDKTSEMKLVNDQHYLSTFKSMCDMLNLNSKIPAILVTQDPDSFDYFKRAGINISHLDTHRSHDIQNGKYIYFGNLIISLIEIWAMIKTNYIFSTRRSNFDQVRLALQQTVGFKTDALNFDVGQLRCLTAVQCKHLGTVLDFSTFYG